MRLELTHVRPPQRLLLLVSRARPLQLARQRGHPRLKLGHGGACRVSILCALLPRGVAFGRQEPHLSLQLCDRHSRRARAGACRLRLLIHLLERRLCFAERRLGRGVLGRGRLRRRVELCDARAQPCLRFLRVFTAAMV